MFLMSMMSSLTLALDSLPVRRGSETAAHIG